MNKTTTDVAREWLTRTPLFLDTETTGLRASAEICEIALVNHDGEVLLDALVKPARAIPGDAMAIHGITNAMVKDAPTFADLLPELDRQLAGRDVVIYNAGFDQKMLLQSAAARNVRLAPWWRANQPAEWHCAMLLYAEHYGAWDEYRQSFRWQSLENAARQCRLPTPANAHRARSDAELTRQLILHMANQLF